MSIILILALLIVPFIIGKSTLKFLLTEGKNSKNWEAYIIGVLVCILMGEAAHICTLFLHWDFSRFILVYSMLLFITFFAACMVLHFGREKKKSGFKHNALAERNGWMFLFGILVFFQCCFHIFLHVPDAAKDVMLETVTTMVSTDTVYEINPMTGDYYLVGIPTRLKILALPSIYAFLSEFFHVNPQMVVYNIIPAFCLGMTYLVCFGWAGYFYPEKKESQMKFMVFCAIVLQFGNYAAMTLSYGLFHRGYQGEVFCAGVLYPYILLKCLQKKKRIVLLCILIEIGIVWTFYGLGGSVFISVVAFFILFLQNRKKEGGSKE